jgi:hypothetical protein
MFDPGGQFLLAADNWDGDVYKGTPFNILNLLIFLFVAVPLFGLIFAYQARLPSLVPSCQEIQMHIKLVAVRWLVLCKEARIPLCEIHSGNSS